jgi:hypothetical protein
MLRKEISNCNPVLPPKTEAGSSLGSRTDTLARLPMLERMSLEQLRGQRVQKELHHLLPKPYEIKGLVNSAHLHEVTRNSTWRFSGTQNLNIFIIGRKRDFHTRAYLALDERPKRIIPPDMIVHIDRFQVVIDHPKL